MKQYFSFPSFLLLSAIVLLASCGNDTQTAPNMQQNPVSLFDQGKFTPPHPLKKPHEIIDPTGVKRNDPYYWMNERDNPEVKAYLEAENKYFDSVMAPVAGLQQKLFDEMVARVKQDDNSVPYFKNGYWYYVRFETGKQYPVYCRRPQSLEAKEQIMIDVNALAQGKPYCLVTGLNVSPDNRLLFYAADYTGRNLFKAAIKDLNTGADLPDSFDSAFGASAWCNDSKTIIYDTKDDVTLRTDKVWKHSIGTDAGKDVLMFHEKDETAYASVSKSKSEQYIFINHGYTENIETHFMDANNANGQFTVFLPRQKGIFYSLEHFQDRFLIRTNWEALNYRLMETPISKIGRENWKDVLPHREDVFLEEFEVFKDYLVALERSGGLKQMSISKWGNNQRTKVDFGEPTYDVDFDNNPEFDTKNLRYSFSSLKTPRSVVDYDMSTNEKTVKKVEPVLGGFDSNNYSTEFIWAKARDGAMVPISIVYKKQLKRDGKAPCYLLGYGSYGSSYDPSFQKPIISLLDRGFVFAIAHIRGGKEMGYKWYEDGKMTKKMNTFYDFIDCAETLCNEKYTNKDRLFASGRSAGGLLMGAVANLRPDLFKGIIAGVPFVDVLTTMGDASIPLTTGEYTEWGNPAIKEEYDYMAKYSPYDNLKEQAYPNLMVVTSFHDSQVQYFEPAKWVAKLRDVKKGDNMLIFNTNMSGSHGGASGRFEQLKERAREYAWMMGLMGIKDEAMKN